MKIQIEELSLQECYYLKFDLEKRISSLLSTSDSDLPNKIDKILPLVFNYIETEYLVLESDLKKSDGIEGSRNRELCDIRFILFNILSKYRFTQKNIGKIFGGRDHSTVIHGIRKYNQYHETDSEFRAMSEDLESKFEEFVSENISEHN